MPKGIFLVVHDEIKGPQLKCSYYTDPVNLPQEFISKLYMSHASFDSASNMELKFEHLRSVSCFTGNLARRSKREGILGIIFEDREKFDNLDLFLQRNLFYAIDNPNEETIEDLFTNKLQHFLALNEIFNKVEIESIPEIFIINGDGEFKSCLLKIGDKKVSHTEMGEIFKKILEKQSDPQYKFVELNSEVGGETFLVLKTNTQSQKLDNIIPTLKSYLDEYSYFSLEILALLLLPSILNIIPIKLKIDKKFSDKSKTVIEILGKSDNYSEDFDNLVSLLVKNEIYLSATL